MMTLCGVYLHPTTSWGGRSSLLLCRTLRTLMPDSDGRCARGNGANRLHTTSSYNLEDVPNVTTSADADRAVRCSVKKYSYVGSYRFLRLKLRVTHGKCDSHGSVSETKQLVWLSSSSISTLLSRERSSRRRETLFHHSDFLDF